MLWRKLNGKKAFTGIVQINIDDPEHGQPTFWQDHGMDSLFELVDKSDIDGERTLLSPDRFWEIMEKYDR